MDDVLLLSPLALRLGEGGELEEPGLHGLAMVEGIETDAQAKHMRVVHANVNLTSPHAADGEVGTPAANCTRVSIRMYCFLRICSMLGHCFSGQARNFKSVLT